MTANKHKVPKKVWRRWSEHAQSVFNRVMDTMGDQALFLHPKATRLQRNHWFTTRWNAAWTAADAADGYRTVVSGSVVVTPVRKPGAKPRCRVAHLIPKSLLSRHDRADLEEALKEAWALGFAARMKQEPR